MLEPGAAKEQVAKTAADLMEWSQRNRERIRGIVSARDRGAGMAPMGVASQAELDALKKRVRELERAAGMTASGRGTRTRPGQEDRRQEVLRQTDHGRSPPLARPPPRSATTATAPRRGRLADRMTRRRLDAELVRRGLAASRAEAQDAVRAGLVTVAGTPATKAATLVADDVPVDAGGARPAVRLARR